MLRSYQCVNINNGARVKIKDGEHAGKTGWLIFNEAKSPSDEALVSFDQAGYGSARINRAYIELISMWFAVIGRIPGDDKDTAKAFHANSPEDAIECFAQEMYGQSHLDRDEVRAANGTAILISHVMESESPINQTSGIKRSIY